MEMSRAQCCPCHDHSERIEDNLGWLCARRYRRRSCLAPSPLSSAGVCKHMADYEDVRRRIISTVFTRRNAAGNMEESYVAHLKIWEIEGGNDKARYIILSSTFPKACPHSRC